MSLSPSSSSLLRPPTHGCGLCGFQRTTACRRPLGRGRLRGLFCTRPPLDAAAVGRSWQTRVRLSLDAAIAYARST
ncbi:hypothetical protein BHE74_00053066 [Ensete ventricosum]|nr:hypothetical protein GW17_00053709 [Ensete ventricosum]RWW41455.1 hypothetical protein BHE74_00053066 [Ensete ventricosum]RZS24860.1 hypothetical protein BHM03_00057976 [Ensete ventricosum]